LARLPKFFRNFGGLVKEIRLKKKKNEIDSGVVVAEEIKFN